MYETRNIYNPNEDCRWSGTCCGGSAKCVRCTNRDIEGRIKNMSIGNVCVTTGKYHVCSNKDFDILWKKYLEALAFSRFTTSIIGEKSSKRNEYYAEMTKYIYAKYKEIALSDSESEEFKYDPSYRFNPDRHHVIDNIGEVTKCNDGETVSFTGVALTDNVSGKCLVADPMKACTGTDKFTIPMIQLVGIPSEVPIVRGMCIKILAGLIKRDNVDDRKSCGYVCWFLGYCEKKREGNNAIVLEDVDFYRSLSM